MNWNEYLELSEKTLSTEFHCGYKVELLLHAVIGSLTEIDELLDNHYDNKDIVNINEEIFDNFWYLAIIARMFDINVSLDNKVESSLTNPSDIVLNITRNLLKMLDILKKKIYYNKDMDESSLKLHTNNVISLFLVYAKLYDINVGEGLDRNINKLKARYGEKFSSERAINRNLEAERNILEGN